jgi:two-component system sensor histidine kinase HydH
MKISQPRKLYVPALIIVAVVFSLLVFIGFSTYGHLDHARTNALTFVHQSGIATIQIMETSIRSLWGTCASKEESIDQLIKEVGENEYVTYAYMVNKEYEILHHSMPLPAGTSGLWLNQMSGSEEILRRIHTLSDGIKVYELAETIRPLSQERLGNSDDFLKYNGGIIVIGLNMSTYEMARQMDFQHAIVMLSILAVLGGGAVFFIFVIHLYHRMNQRLRETQEYTRQVVDSMANGLLSIDIDGRILSYNNLSLEILGLAQSDIEQLDLNKVIDFETSGISQTLHQCVMILDREINIEQTGGERLPLAISVTPILSLNPK